MMQTAANFKMISSPLGRVDTLQHLTCFDSDVSARQFFFNVNNVNSSSSLTAGAFFPAEFSCHVDQSVREMTSLTRSQSPKIRHNVIIEKVKEM